MAWLKKLAAGVGAFLTEWAGHPRRIRGTVEHIYSGEYGSINCKLGQFPFRLDEIQDQEIPKQGDTQWNSRSKERKKKALPRNACSACRDSPARGCFFRELPSGTMCP